MALYYGKHVSCCKRPVGLRHESLVIINYQLSVKDNSFASQELG
jgi:hypothetical protein